MKKRLLSLVLVFGLFSTSAFAVTAAESIAAIVNDSVITRSDIKNRADLYLAGAAQPSAEQRQQVEQQVLSRLIDEALQVQEAKKLGITVDEGAVTAGFANIASQNKLAPEEFKKQLIAGGTSLDTLYTQIRADIAWSQVVRRKLRPEVDISDTEIDQTLDQIAQGRGKTQYLVAEIFLKVSDPAKDADRREETEKLIKKLTEGASFVTVARQHSQSPGATHGGDLGWVQEGQLDAELDKALKKMQPGQISPPVRTDKGYHILFLREQRRNEAPSAKVEPVAGPVVSLKQIVIPLTAEDPDTVVAAKTVRGRALKDEIKSCDDMDAKMKDFPAPGSGDLGTVAEASLPAELQAVIAGLKPGELSDPIRSPSGIVVIMLCAREDAAPDARLPKFSLTKDDAAARVKIADKLGTERLNQMAVRYLRDLRATAFIDKRI